MAGIALPNIAVTLSGVASSALTPGYSVPAGKAESCCVLASLSAGVQPDAWVDISVFGSLPNLPFQIICNEPVRYRTPGGSPVLLMNFIIGAGCYLAGLNNQAASSVYFLTYNRWQFDA